MVHGNQRSLIRILHKATIALLIVAVIFPSCSDNLIEEREDEVFEKAYERKVNAELFLGPGIINGDRYVLRGVSDSTALSGVLSYDLVTGDLQSVTDNYSMLDVNFYTYMCGGFVVVQDDNSGSFKMMDVDNLSNITELSREDFYMYQAVAIGACEGATETIYLATNTPSRLNQFFEVDLQSGTARWQLADTTSVDSTMHLYRIVLGEIEQEPVLYYLKSTASIEEPRLMTNKLQCYTRDWELLWSKVVSVGQPKTRSISIAVVQGQVVALVKDSLMAFSAKDGTRKWQRSIHTDVVSELRVIEDELYYNGYRLERIDPADGTTMWTSSERIPNFLETSYSPDHIGVTATTIIDRATGEEMHIPVSRYLTSMLTYQQSSNMWIRHNPRDSTISGFRIIK